MLRAGTVRLTVLAGQPDEAFDFDGGAKQAAGARRGRRRAGPDRDRRRGVRARPAGADARRLLGGPGRAVDSDRVLLAALLPTAKVCVRTGEQRFGWFSPRPGDAVISGQLYTTYLDFTVWKKTGD